MLITNKDANGHLKSYLSDTVFMEKTNHSNVDQAVVQVLNRCDFSFNNVVCFNTDNAAYMKKAFHGILHGLYLKAIHCMCLAHIIYLHLVREAF